MGKNFKGIKRIFSPFPNLLDALPHYRFGAAAETNMPSGVGEKIANERDKTKVQLLKDRKKWKMKWKTCTIYSPDG